jgi:hypothetical protein
MKTVGVILEVFLFALLLETAGCEPVPPEVTEPPSDIDNASDELSVYTRYAPVKIDIIPLTEFVCVSGAAEMSKLA